MNDLAEQTHANVEDLFETFLKNFKSKTGKLKYRSIISNMISDNSESLLINFKDILQYDDQLSRQLIDDPDSILLDFTSSLSRFQRSTFFTFFLSAVFQLFFSQV